MVVAPSATAEHVGGARQPVALHRDGSCRQVPPIRLARCSRLSRLGNDRHRARRRIDQQVSQTAVCDTRARTPSGPRRRVSYPVSDSMSCRCRAKQHGAETARHLLDRRLQDKRSAVRRPVPDVVFCLVPRVHSRLHIEILHLPSLRWPGGRSWITAGARSGHQRPYFMAAPCWRASHLSCTTSSEEPPLSNFNSQWDIPQF